MFVLTDENCNCMSVRPCARNHRSFGFIDCLSSHEVLTESIYEGSQTLIVRTRCLVQGVRNRSLSEKCWRCHDIRTEGPEWPSAHHKFFLMNSHLVDSTGILISYLRKPKEERHLRVDQITCNSLLPQKELVILRSLSISVPASLLTSRMKPYSFSLSCLLLIKSLDIPRLSSSGGACMHTASSQNSCTCSSSGACRVCACARRAAR